MATLRTLSESRKILFAIFRLIHDERISTKDASLISNCADDFTKLFSLRLKQWKRSGKEPAPVKGAPDLRKLADLLARADFPAAVAEAKRVRALMKPIIAGARAKLKVAAQ